MIELLVVILILGVLGSFAVPRYLEAVEKNKSDQAVARLQVVANANRMFHADNPNKWAGDGSSPLSSSCNAAGNTCDPNNPSPCNLVACGYLSKEPWESLGYHLTPVPDTSGVIAVAQRCSGAPPCTDNPDYSQWGYQVTDAGDIVSMGGAPTAVNAPARTAGAQ